MNNLTNTARLIEIAEKLDLLGYVSDSDKYFKAAQVGTVDHFDAPDGPSGMSTEEAYGQGGQVEASIKLSEVLADSVKDMAQIIGLNLGDLIPETHYNSASLMKIKSIASQIIQAVDIIGSQAAL